MVEWVALLVIAGGAIAGASWLAKRRRERTAARVTAATVADVCAELADDLRMGRVPEDAIAATAARWPPMRRVAAAAELHHGVAPALLDVASFPGAAGLRDVGAAWQVSERAGSGLAEALDQVSRLLAARERRVRFVDAELAAARATGVVVSGLPLLVLGMGSGLGTNPWSFFVSGLGSVALGGAALLLLAGWVWLDRLTAQAMPTRRPSPKITDDEVSLLRRFRIPLSVLAAAAGWAFVGGIPGVIAGATLAPVAWRTLTNARSPGEIRRQELRCTDYPLVVELLANALSAGADVETALRLVATAVGDPWESHLGTSLNALAVGQPPAVVWAALEQDPCGGTLGRALARAHATGVPVSDAMRRLAKDLREDADLEAHAYARTIEVRAAVPLGVCFLPAFVLLGVVPLVAGVLSNLAWIDRG